LNKVTVVIPVYNGEKYLAKAIDSVICQTFESWTLYIVNDGSTDSSGDIVSNYLKDKRIIYLSQSNGGVANARNVALHQSVDEYFALLDQDDVWYKDKLKIQVDMLNSDVNLGFVHGVVDCIGPQDEKVSCIGKMWVGEYKGWCLHEFLTVNGVAPLTILARRKAILACGGFSQQRAPADDWDMWLRLTRDHPVGYTANPIGAYRVHESNESRKILKMRLAEITVLKAYLADFSKSTLPADRAVIDRKLTWLLGDAARLSQEKGAAADASRLRLQALKTRLTSRACYCDAVTSLVPELYRKQALWYMSRLLGIT